MKCKNWVDCFFCGRRIYSNEVYKLFRGKGFVDCCMTCFIKNRRRQK